MVKVIVFEVTGQIRLATLIDPTKGVFRENLTDFQHCPSNILARVPSQIADFCMEAAPQYLFLNSDGKWESSPGKRVI